MQRSLRGRRASCRPAPASPCSAVTRAHAPSHSPTPAGPRARPSPLAPPRRARGWGCEPGPPVPALVGSRRGPGKGFRAGLAPPHSLPRLSPAGRARGRGRRARGARGPPAPVAGEGRGEDGGWGWGGRSCSCSRGRWRWGPARWRPSSTSPRCCCLHAGHARELLRWRPRRAATSGEERPGVPGRAGRARCRCARARGEGRGPRAGPAAPAAAFGPAGRREPRSPRAGPAQQVRRTRARAPGLAADRPRPRLLAARDLGGVRAARRHSRMAPPGPRRVAREGARRGAAAGAQR